MIGKVDHHKVKQHTTFLINNQYSIDSKIIANQFNEYFIKVGSALANNIKSHVDPLSYVQRNKTTLNIPDIMKSNQLYVLFQTQRQDMMKYLPQS